MSEPLTHAQFAECVGDIFSVEADAGPAGQIQMALIEASPLPTQTMRERSMPFSLVFRAAADEVLPQRIYRMQHQRLGVMEIFLVPIGPDEEGMCYEAVFN